MEGAAPNPVMDIDLMDELFLDGCWLETMCGSEFLLHSPSSNMGFCDPLYSWPSPDDCKAETRGHELVQRPSIPTDVQFVGQKSFSDPTLIPSQLENHINDNSDIRKTWWIGPKGDGGSPGSSVMDRLIKALSYIQDFSEDKDVLIQLWIPVNRGGKRVLTTSEQPFSLNPSSRSLSRYRDISVNFQFSAEEDSKELMGLPSRVFLGKIPEWTPDARFFRSDEYPRVDHAQQFDVRGTLALPVFEKGSMSCLGVIEVVTTIQKIKYHPEIQSVCKALEAVDLRSSGILNNPNAESCKKTYQAALPEILEVLRSACKTHGLPLAQTWVSCIQQGKGGCRHSDENFALCISPVENACHVEDPHAQGFHEACLEYHLLKCQGIVGKAFLTSHPCFSPDVTSFTKMDYPLSHHARMFGLSGAVAIRFRNIQIEMVDFVLELFLPMGCKVLEEQRKMLASLSVIIQQTCINLRVVRDDELREELITSTLYPPAENLSYSEKANREISECENVSWEKNSPRDDSQWIRFGLGVDAKNSQLAANLNIIGDSLDKKSTGFREVNQTLSLNTSDEHGEDHSIRFSGSGMKNSGVKKRSKAEKTISLQVLQQYFPGSLKDASKSLGVCPTTLKRICRQHGINRWPSRKIKKVGHSLQKLQVVMNSVEGASCPLQISSFYRNVPGLPSHNASAASPFSSLKPGDPQNLPSTKPESDNIMLLSNSLSSPSLSCSQSSTSSSQCCSNGTKLHSSSCKATNPEELVWENNSNNLLKRTQSEAELNVPGQEGLGTKLILGSQSHGLISETSKLKTPRDAAFDRSDVFWELESLRVKVTYGELNIRFRLQKGSRLGDLWNEIQRRFIVEDPSRFDLKYLDDDFEWILLTCDADLEECIEVSGSSQGNTIRLSLQVSHIPPLLGE
ncbi:hypothetical protein SAY86_013055 [Trapa natans]|uniref:Nodule inception protein n=1 Tax=Trapa natans TaxID=22666 RepID=A0AAN7RC72_TRANT|nr:hypothetical protein SAY86_013055 [Trapa natans]